MGEIKMKILITLTSIILFLSCKTELNRSYYISEGRIKYWESIDTLGRVDGCFSFSNKGECFAYYYNERENCKRYKSFDDDVIYENIWVLKNDSILRYRSSFDHKILILNSDTLLTEYNGFKHLLVRSKCQKENPLDCKSIGVLH